MSDEPTPQRYFLSYSRTDQELALRFANDLRASGVAIWVDQLDIRPSEHWDRAIEKAVRECCGLLVLLSPRSVASDNVADEISFALEHGKSVLPVMIERCRLPLRITRMQVIDATGDYCEALGRCLAALSGRCVDPIPVAPVDAAADVLDDTALAAAKKELTALLGPIASVLVDKEAQRASSLANLREMLAKHIPEKKDRERFTRGNPKAAPDQQSALTNKPEPVSTAELERLGSLLTRYLGPVAPVIVRRESAMARSPAELEERLAHRIPDGRERAEFLRGLRGN